jgi:hypothetical protein
VYVGKKFRSLGVAGEDSGFRIQNSGFRIQESGAIPPNSVIAFVLS